jgi:peptide/nickel transport system permease protein
MVLMRIVDLLYALPGLLVAIALLGVLGGDYSSAVIMLIVLTAPVDLRVVRGAALEQRSLPYVEAARTVGVREWSIMFRHVLPNISGVVIANSFLNFAYSLVSLSALSYLGLGVGPGAADWGRMLADNLPLLEQNAWASLGPALALVLLATSMNLIGDGLFEKYSDRGERA